MEETELLDYDEQDEVAGEVVKASAAVRFHKWSVPIVVAFLEWIGSGLEETSEAGRLRVYSLQWISGLSAETGTSSLHSRLWI